MFGAIEGHESLRVHTPLSTLSRLFDSVQRQLSELTALHAVARAAVSASGLDEIIARAVPALHQRMGCDVLAIYLLDPEPALLRLHPWFVTRFPALAGAAEIPVGAGLAGRHAARALLACQQQFVMIELNARIVRTLRDQGLPVYYADATSEEALRHAHLDAAKLLVLLIDDPQGAERVVATAKRVAPGVPIVMRTHYLRETAALVAVGATAVVAEEVEGAIEVIARMLRALDMTPDQIDERLALVRKDTAAQGPVPQPTD